MDNPKRFIFKPENWYTPNTYNENFKEPTSKSGVYLLVIVKFNKITLKPNFKIVYVGSAKNLQVRYARHEVIRFLRETNQYIHFYFKEEDEFRIMEKELIKLIQPKYNKQWR